MTSQAIGTDWSSPDNIHTLAQLRVGTCAMVVGITQDHWTDGTDADRLIALGICPGRQVEMIKHGDPQIVRACGARVGLSQRLAECIRVKACDKAECMQQLEAN